MSRTTVLIAVVTVVSLLLVLPLAQPGSNRVLKVHDARVYVPIDMTISSSEASASGKQRVCVILRAHLPDQIIQLDAMSIGQMISENLRGQSYEATSSGLLVGVGTSVKLVIFDRGNMTECLLYTFPKSDSSDRSIIVSATNQDGYRLIQNLPETEFL